MARFWGFKPDKDRTVSFISHRSFKSNQLKLIEMIWTDVKTRILHQNDTLSPCPDVFSAACCQEYLIMSFLRLGVIFHNVGLWQVQPLPLICEERSRNVAVSSLGTKKKCCHVISTNQFPCISNTMIHSKTQPWNQPISTNLICWAHFCSHPTLALTSRSKIGSPGKCGFSESRVYIYI